MQIEKLIKKHIQVWDSKVMAIPYASKQYKEHLKQFIDGLVKREETKFQDEHPVDCIDGVTPVETYGYEATYNQAKKETISHLKEIGKQLE